ncbi:MAG: EscU/YscU/HrcU family type III secretion system export apparatus switch protein [Planctomycetota bacterium]
MADDMGEKSEEPTAKRLAQARSDGQIGRSQDLSSAILLIGGVLLLAIFGFGVVERFRTVMDWSLAGRDMSAADILSDTMEGVTWSAHVMVGGLIPIFLLIFVVAYLGGLLQVGLLFTPKTLQPKLDKLNPQKGLTRLFSKKSLVKGGLDPFKFVVLAAVMIFVIHRHDATLYGMPAMGLMRGLAEMGRIAVELVIVALLMLLILGIVDFIYQKWQMHQDLKMTKHAVKDERRSMEGDPQLKGQRFKLAREMLTQQLGKAVPEADVIVTNPTHYAIALKYDGEAMAAPRVTAKGADYVAMRIRQLAVMHGVPIVERPPLARALYDSVPVGGEVSPAHYEAVAEVLAYVYRLEGRAAG